MCTAESLLEFESSGSDTLLRTYLIKISEKELDICICQIGASDICKAFHDPFPTSLPHLLPLSTLYCNPPAIVGCMSFPKSTKLFYLHCSAFAKAVVAFWNAVHFLLSLAHSLLCILWSLHHNLLIFFFTITSLLTYLTSLLYSAVSQPFAHYHFLIQGAFSDTFS